MKKEKINTKNYMLGIIISLQLVFIVGMLTLWGATAFRKASLPAAVTTLRQAAVNFADGTPEQARFMARAGQLRDMIQGAAKVPDNIAGVVGEVGGSELRAVPLEGTMMIGILPAAAEVDLTGNLQLVAGPWRIFAFDSSKLPQPPTGPAKASSAGEVITIMLGGDRVLTYPIDRAYLDTVAQRNASLAAFLSQIRKAWLSRELIMDTARSTGVEIASPPNVYQFPGTNLFAFLLNIQEQEGMAPKPVLVFADQTEEKAAEIFAASNPLRAAIERMLMAPYPATPETALGAYLQIIAEQAIAGGLASATVETTTLTQMEQIPQAAARLKALRGALIEAQAKGESPNEAIAAERAGEITVTPSTIYVRGTPLTSPSYLVLLETSPTNLVPVCVQLNENGQVAKTAVVSYPDLEDVDIAIKDLTPGSSEQILWQQYVESRKRMPGTYTITGGRYLVGMFPLDLDTEAVKKLEASPANLARLDALRRAIMRGREIAGPSINELIAAEMPKVNPIPAAVKVPGTEGRFLVPVETAPNLNIRLLSATVKGNEITEAGFLEGIPSSVITAIIVAMEESNPARPVWQLAGLQKGMLPAQVLITGANIAAAKASSAGVVYQLLPDLNLQEVELVGITAGKIETKQLARVDTTKEWNYVEIAPKTERLAGVVLAEPTATPKEKVKGIIERAAAMPALPTSLAQLTTPQQAIMLEGAGAIVNLPLPGAEPARALLELQKGPEYVTFLQESIAETKQILGADMVGNAVDINALGTIGTDAEGKKKFLPSVNLMTLAMLANNLGPNFKITVFSIAGLDKSLTAEEMRSLLGPYASIFADIMQAADVGQVVSTIKDNQKIPEEKIVVTVAQSTLQRALREGIDIYKNLTAAVKRIMIKQPTMAVASYKALLIDTLKFLKGALPPSQIEALRKDIQNAPDSMLENTLIVEPKGEESETEVSSRQQAAVAV